MTLRSFGQRQTENSYTREVELAFADCDRNGSVRPADGQYVYDPELPDLVRYM